MKMKRIAIAAVAVLALASLGGVALAKTPAQHQNAPATSETTTVADTDTVQQGDQSTPDTGTEVGGESDGGHADPAGNVDHQFEGQE